ncbi:beta strand repeat-containing protein [Cryptosporangium aurantiacum]|uniref:Immunoglobulin I-set domain-containing protein n=1 Tax=Cryptosporangium aurantiacum TaxID=134849 RepID=A0A1M7RJD5_9ACTN|nr:immunoglobulin domain-containing protein [Cryptosporangium aurantiacum]SHN46384.1 Immunoglobulin I-set domain-containing protein [Cryptosporangium aurantiacum]
MGTDTGDGARRRRRALTFAVGLVTALAFVAVPVPAVAVPPAIQLQPVNDGSAVNGSVEFTVESSNATSYEWQYDAAGTWTAVTDGSTSTGAPLGATISGATTDTLSLSDLAAGLNGTRFRVKLSNADGDGDTFSNVVTLTVGAAPDVGAAVADPVRSAAGTSLDITAPVTAGATPLSWRWQRLVGNAWTSVANATGTPGVSGARSATLTISNVTAALNGAQYRALVTNGVGTDISDPVTLEIGASPTVSIAGNVTLNSGNSTTLTATRSGDPTPTLQWQQSTDGGSTFNDIQAQTATTLVLSNVTTALNNRQYRARATNIYNSATSNVATLTVAGIAPSVSIAGTAALNSGDSMVLTATKSGDPTPTLQWQRSTDGGSTFVDIATQTGDTLTVSSVSTSMTGYEYRVVATNSVTTATSNVKTLTVTGTTPAVSISGTVALNSGDSTTLTATRSGDPTPTLQWQRSTNGGSTFVDIATETGTTLTVGPVTASMNGYQYRVVATNSVTSTPSEARTLAVAGIAPAVSVSADQSVVSGNPASFTATVSAGDPAPTLQWQRSTDGGSTFADIATETGTTLTLPSVTASMTDYRYRVVATNSVTSTNSVARTLTVAGIAPSVSVAPDRTVVAGSSTSFTATVSAGDPAPTLQWQRSTNGGSSFTNITGAVGDTLHLTSVDTSMSNYRYRVLATNSVTSAVSNARTLTVQPTPPTVTTPGNAIAASDRTATFTVDAEGDPAPTVQWQYRTPAGNWSDLSDGPGVSGATTETLSLSDLTSGSDGYRYRAVVTNSAGSVPSDSATLTVGTAPSVTDPASQTTSAGGTAVFSVSVTGSPLPSVQWETTTDGQAWTNLQDGSGVSGATSTTLVLSGVTAEMDGRQYRAMATNPAGEPVPSQSATLTVRTPPSVTTDPLNATARNGAATFSIAVEGTPVPEVQWQYLAASEGARWTDVTGVESATSATLELTGLTPAEDGYRYRAVVTNAAGTVNSDSATLSVGAAPTVTNPSAQSVVAGGTAVFSVSVTGSPLPQVRWQVRSGDSWTPMENGPGILGERSTTLVLSGVRSAQDGEQYRATVTNSAGGPVASEPATLTVGQPPTVSSDPNNAIVQSGGSAVFSVTVAGTPTPSVQWQQLAATNGATWTNLTNGTGVAGATSDRLELSSLSDASFGYRYRAAVSNTFGTVYSGPATLSVGIAPTVTDPNSVTASGGAATFSVSLGGAPTPTVQWQRKIPNGVWTNVSGATSTTLSLTGLTTAQSGYRYRAIASNGIGNPAVSDSAVLTVQVTPPTVTAPTSVTAVNGTATFTVTVAGDPAPTLQWQALPPAAGATWANLTNGTGISGATSNTLTLTGLTTARTGYRYRVVATTTAATVTSPSATLTVR